MEHEIQDIRSSSCQVIAALNSKLKKFESLIRACDYYESEPDPDLEKFIKSEFKRLTDYDRKSN